MKKIKVHSLTGRITPQVMHEAFRAVKRNRGAAGVDKVSVQMFEQNLEANLNKLMRELKDGTFRPVPLRRVHIPKGPGSTKTRPLGIPTVRDRVAQEVLRRLLAPIFEPLFHENSYGFIPNRNCHMAIERVLELHRQGNHVVLDADIQGFFDNIPHKIIMQKVAAEIADGNILRLVERFLIAGVMEDGVFSPTNIGTPQGGVISPLLANIVLNPLDWELDKAGYRFARYADDFVVVCRTKGEAQEALAVVRRVLETELGLKLSPEKTKIGGYGKGYDFLGFRLSSRSRRMRDKSLLKFEAKIRELTIRHHNLDRHVIEKLNRVIRGTANYFTPLFSTCRWSFQKLDSWIRMRLRCMKKKRKNYNDNDKLRVNYFRYKLGLLSLEQFCKYRDEHGEIQFVIPRRGATSIGVAR
jgi:group II intron reverse transcriptase/maturase